MGKPVTNLKYEIKKILKSKEKFGESKHSDKKNHTMKDGIYSRNTAKMYNRECQKFADFAIQQHGNAKLSVAESRDYATEYLKNGIENGMSPYTLQMQRSALAKLYGCTGNDICDLPPRHRADITRSRNHTVVSEKTGKIIKNQSVRAGHFSEKNNAEIVAFCRSTGLRRSELESLTGDQLEVAEDGNAYIHLKGYQCKGGRPRVVPVIGDVSNAITLCQNAGRNKVFHRVPQAMDVHSYRSEYAVAIYNQYARPIDELEQKEKYYCRAELKGTVYDREAMLMASKALGHNRISIIAEHYLR